MADGPEEIGQMLARYLRSLGEPRSDAEVEAHLRKRRMAEAREMAELRGVPESTDVYEVAMQPLLTGPMVDHVRRALAWRASKGKSTPCCIMLVSAPGLGKSVAMTHAVLYSDRPAYYVSADRLLSQKEWEAKEAWARSRKASLLALDELGTEADPDAAVRLMLDRWTNGGATICATNLDANELQARYFSGSLGTRLADRLRGQTEQGLKGVVVVKGKSRRHKGGA